MNYRYLYTLWLFLFLPTATLGYKFKITNKTGIDITVFVLNPGRTYLDDIKPEGDTVSHTKPRLTKFLKNDESVEFTTGGDCIGAILARPGENAWTFSYLAASGKKAYGFILNDQGSPDHIVCYRKETLPYSTGGTYEKRVKHVCRFVDTTIPRCGIFGKKKKWKIVTKKVGEFGLGEWDLQND